LKQNNGGRVQFLHRTTFHSNRPRRHDLGTYRLQRDGPVPYQSVFFEEKPSFFDKHAPKPNSPCLATSTRQKGLCVGPLFLNNRSDRARIVVHSSPSCMFHASSCTIQSKKFCSNFHFLVTCYLLCMEMMSSCLQLSSFFLGLGTIIIQY